MKQKDFFDGKLKLVSKNPITSLGDYFNHIKYAQDYIFSNAITWFRGHANKDYQLKPGIFRISNYTFEKELNIRDEFFDKAQGFVLGKELKGYEWYFLMQHYGLPTRLLDWTEGYLIALFFALKLSEKDNHYKNPCVWIINPKQLNFLSIGSESILRTVHLNSENQDNTTVNNYFYLQKNENDQFPIAISATYSNERILRQKGCFSIHGTENIPIEKFYQRKKCKDIVQIVINNKSRTSILEELANAGISESSIFPDLEGLAREIRNKHIK